MSDGSKYEAAIGQKQGIIKDWQAKQYLITLFKVKMKFYRVLHFIYIGQKV